MLNAQVGVPGIVLAAPPKFAKGFDLFDAQNRKVSWHFLALRRSPRKGARLFSSAAARRGKKGE